MLNMLKLNMWHAQTQHVTCSNETFKGWLEIYGSLKVIENLIPCGTFWVRKEDNKEQEAMLQNISDGIARVFQLQYFIPIALHVHTPSL